MKHIEAMEASYGCFPLIKPALIIVREKETIMKHVSLNKIKPSMLTKVPGLFILGLLAVAFLLFPLAAFAGCGQQAAAQAGLIQSRMSLFGKACGGTPLSTQQASLLAASWADPTKGATSKNATIDNKPAQPQPQPGSTTPASSRLTGLSLLGAIARCSFVTVPDGQKVSLANGDLVLVSVTQKDKTITPIVGEVVGGKLVALTGDGQGQHAVKIANNANIKLSNGTLPK
jgi:hypothetical protein